MNEVFINVRAMAGDYLDIGPQPFGWHFMTRLQVLRCFMSHLAGKALKFGVGAFRPTCLLV